MDQTTTTPKSENHADGDGRISARLAYLTTAGFFVVLLCVLLRPTSAAGGALEVLMGALGAGWVSVIGFYFGSSAGSRAKTALLAARD